MTSNEAERGVLSKHVTEAIIAHGPSHLTDTLVKQIQAISWAAHLAHRDAQLPGVDELTEIASVAIFKQTWPIGRPDKNGLMLDWEAQPEEYKEKYREDGRPAATAIHARLKGGV